MKITPTQIQGVHVIDVTRHEDDRGFFARSWDADELTRHGLDTALHLSAITHNKIKGTLRGMHFQAAPMAETKFVRVTRGSIFDVALDLRKESPTYLRWHGEILSERNHRQLYIPKGCAHGYLTLEDDTELTYFLSAAYSLEHARGVRYNDQAFGIIWPGEIRLIAPRDAAYADYVP
ncbi:MAG: dTDP-4-dehydrorhamnose 3,5-epimerase family protein [Burkholderiales bacterium]|nr:dTDP-4-dehydrorhamnose 3,5-epimerase family protein [Phycisphaerae bacterium]